MNNYTVKSKGTNILNNQLVRLIIGYGKNKKKYISTFPASQTTQGKWTFHALVNIQLVYKGQQC